MLDKIKNWFGPKQESYVSALRFRDGIKALGMEMYKNVAIFYLAKPIKGSWEDETQPIYHIFHKNKFYSGEADTFESLQNKARWAVDHNFKEE